MRGNRSTYIVLALIAAVVVLFFIFRDDIGKRALPPQASAPQVPASSAAGNAAASQSGPQGAEPEIIRPSFDVVRISQNCTAVIAGRAASGALVTVKAGDQELGRVTADGRGEWALVPDLPLQAGSREISLSSRLGNAAEVAAAAVVVVSVPVCDPNTPSGEQTVAVLTPRQGASRLLQIPDSDKAAMAAKGLALDTVDYDDVGNLVMSGRAKPNTTVQVYVNNQPVGAPTADAKGRWTLKLDQTIPPGLYTLRVDQVEDSGKVVSRLELPFARASAADIDLKTGSVVVQPGNSLWRLARATYGDGAQFTTIYQNNQDQIRDPNLIYPGQVFSLPKPKTAGN